MLSVSPYYYEHTNVSDIYSQKYIHLTLRLRYILSVSDVFAVPKVGVGKERSIKVG